MSQTRPTTPTTPIGSTGSSASLAATGRPLAVGTLAPPFSLPCGPQCNVTLADFRGRPVVLAFYVADWHPVCAAQLERYRGLTADLERFGAALVAISADGVWCHAAFTRAMGLDFPLLADSAPRGAAPTRTSCSLPSGGSIVSVSPRSAFATESAGTRAPNGGGGDARPRRPVHALGG